MRKNYLSKAAVTVIMAVILALGCFAVAFSSTDLNNDKGGSTGDALNRDYASITNWINVGRETWSERPAQDSSGVYIIDNAEKFRWMLDEGWTSTASCRLAANFNIVDDVCYRSTFKMNLSGKNSDPTANNGENYYIKSSYAPATGYNLTMGSADEGKTFAGGFVGLAEGAFTDLNYALTAPFNVEITNDAGGASLQDSRSRNVGGFVGMLAGPNAKMVNCRIFIDNKLSVRDLVNTADTTAIRAGLLAGAIASGKDSQPHSKTDKSIIDRIDGCEISVNGGLEYAIPNNQSNNNFNYRVYTGLIGELEHSNVKNSKISVNSSYALLLNPTIGADIRATGELYASGFAGKLSGVTVSGTEISVNHGSLTLNAARAIYGGIVATTQNLLNGTNGNQTWNGNLTTGNVFDRNKISVSIGGGSLQAWGTSGLGQVVGGFAGVFGQNLTFKNGSFKISDLPFNYFENSEGEESISMFAARMIGGDGTSDPVITIQNAVIDFTAQTTNFDYTAIAPGQNSAGASGDGSSIFNNSGLLIGKPVSGKEGLSNFSDIWILKSQNSGHKIFGGTMSENSAFNSVFSELNYMYYDINDCYFDVEPNASGGLDISPVKNGTGGTYLFDPNRNSTDVTKVGFTVADPVGNFNANDGFLGGTAEKAARVKKELVVAVNGTGTPFAASHPDYYKQWKYSYVTGSGNANKGNKIYAMCALDKLRTIQEINRYADSNNKGYNGDWMSPELVAPDGSNGVITNAGNSALKPIGNATYPFKGIFEGNGVTVETQGFGNTANVGFFGVNNGTVRNLNLTIIGRTGINEQTSINAGFIAGINYGVIEKVSVDVTSGGMMIYNKDTALNSANVGGIVGWNSVSGVLNGSVSNAVMTLDGSFVFNIAKASSGAALNAGGLIGKNESGGKISGIAVNLKNTNGNRFDTVQAATELSKYFGGLVGSANATGAAAEYSNIALAVPVDKKIKNNGGGTANIGYFIGNSDAAIDSNTNVKNVWILKAKQGTVNYWTIGNNNWTTKVNYINADTSKEYDVTASLTGTSPSFNVVGAGEEVLIGWYNGSTRLGISDGVNGASFVSGDANSQNKAYTLNFIGGRISAYAQLKQISDAVNDGVAFEGMTFILQNDLTIDDAAFKPIGTSQSKPFSGYFNGNGKTIEINNMAAAENAGLFGYIKASPLKKTLQDGTTAYISNAGVYALTVVLNGSITASSGSAGILAGVVEGAEIGRYTSSTTGTSQGVSYDVISTQVLPVTVKFGTGATITASANAGAAVGSASRARIDSAFKEAFVGHINVSGASGATLAVNGSNNSSAFIGQLSGAEVVVADINADGITFNGTNKAGIAGAVAGSVNNAMRNILVRFGTTPAEGVFYTVAANSDRTTNNYSNVWAYLGKNVEPDSARLTQSNNFFNVMSVKIAEQSASGTLQDVNAAVLNIKAGYAQQKNNIQFTTSGAGNLNFAGFIGDRTTGSVLSSGSYTPSEDQRGLYAVAVFAKTDINNATDWETMRWYNDNVSVPITFNVKSSFTLGAGYVPVGAVEGKPLNLFIKGGNKTITIPTVTSASDFALFGTVSEHSVLENMSVVVNGTITAGDVDGTLKNAAAVAVVNNGVISAVKVTINYGDDKGLVGAQIGGVAVENNGTIEGAGVVVNGTLNGGLIGGAAAKNSGLIKNSSVAFSYGSVIICTPYGQVPGTEGQTTNGGLIGGIAGENTARIYNSTVNFAGDYRAAGVGNMFLGGVAGYHAGSNAEVRGFNVTVASVGTDGASESVTSFGGVVYTILGGAKISEEDNKENNNNIYISGSSKVGRGFGGIAVAMQGANTSVSNVNVYFQNAENAAAVVEGNSFAAGVVNLTAGKIWDINIESKSYFTFKGTLVAAGFVGDLGAVEVSKIRIVQEGAIIGVGSGAFTSAFISYNRAIANVKDSVILVRNKVENETLSNLKVALYAASTSSTGGTLGNNVWVIAENEFSAETAFNAAASPVNVGVNVLKVVGNATFDASLTMADAASSASDGTISFSVTAQGIVPERLYSSVNERTGFTNSAFSFADGKLTVNGNSVSDRNLTLHLSLFDLDIDSDAEFAAFAQFTRESHFKGVKFNLNADVSLSNTIIGANTPFEGIFDGNKHTISFSGNIVGTNSGLFGAIGRYGEVRNLIVNVLAGTVIGGGVSSYSGGFAGYVEGKISNVAVNFANGQDSSQRVRLLVSTSGGAGVFAGGSGASAVFENVWAASLMNEYQAVGSDADSNVNYLGILGWQNVNVGFNADTYVIVFSAPVEGKVDWYTNYALKTPIPSKASGNFGQVDIDATTYFHANIGAVEARNTLSYFNPEISTQQQLIDLSAFITLLPNVELNVSLTADIVLGEGYTQQNYLDFHPIGSSANPFRGSFDGRNHSITILDSVLISSEYSGLFGVADATISNLVLRVQSPYVGNDGSAANGMLVGSLLGGTPSNIVVEMNVKQLNVTTRNMGGIIGNYSSNAATNNVWLITNDYNVNPTQNSTQSDKFNVIYALNDAAFDSPVTPENPNGTDTFSNGSVQVGAFGIDGITLNAVGDFNGFVIDDVLFTDRSKTIGGTAAFSGKKYYAVAFETKISTLEQLEYLADRIGDNKVRGALNIAGVTYTLTADITVDGAVGALKSFKPIGGENVAFNGIFDGLGHSIVFGENSQIVAENAGLFGATGNKSIVRNLIIEHRGVIEGSSTAGTVVGRSNGSIQNVVVKYAGKSFRESSGTTVRIVGGGGIGAIGSTFENIWLIRNNDVSSYNVRPASDVNYMLLVGQKVSDVTAVIDADGKITISSGAATTDSYNWYSALSASGIETRGNYSPDKALKKQLYYGSTYKLDVADVTGINKINGYLKDALSNGYDLTGVTFFQTADISLGSGFTPIGSTYRNVAGVDKLAEFYSIYDGEGHSITIDQNIKTLAATGETRTYAGLFGVIAAKGSVRNLIVNLEAEIFAENNNAGALSYAGVVAYNNGKLEGVVIKVGEKASVKAVPSLNNLLSTVSVTAGFTNKNGFKNVWVLQSTKNVLSESAIKDSGVNTLTMVGSPNNVTVSFADGISFGISGTLYSDYVASSAYAGSDYTSNTFKPIGFTNRTLQAVSVKNTIENETELAQLAFDVNAGYVMKADYTISTGITIGTAFVVSIGDISKNAAFGGTMTFSGSGKIINNSGLPLFGYISESGSIVSPVYESAGSFNLAYSAGSGTFAVVNEGSVTGGKFTSSATISGERFGVMFGRNNGTVQGGSANYTGVASGKEIAAFVYENLGVIENIEVILGGVMKGVSAVSGDTVASAFAIRNGGTMRNIETSVTGTLKADGIASEYMTGLVSTNSGYIDTVKIVFEDGAKIGDGVGTVYGIVRDNQSDGTTSGTHNAIVYYKSGAMVSTEAVYAVGSGNGRFNNTWVLSYNEYQNTNGQNLILLSGAAEITAKFNASKQFELGFTPASGFATSGLFDGDLNLIASDATSYTFTNTTLQGEEYGLMFLENLLENESDLRNFAAQVNGGMKIGVEVQLANDITISGAGFEPIGKNEAHPFVGTFNGQKHTVTISSDIVGTYAGLFGYVGANGSVKDLNVTLDAGVKVGGRDTVYAGALAGWISGATVGGADRNSKISVSVKGTVEAQNDAGGAIGRVDGSHVENIHIDLGAADGGVSARISANHAGAAIGDTKLITGLTNKLNNATVNIYGGAEVYGSEFAGGIVGRSYIDIDGIYVVNYGVVRGATAGLIIGKNVGKIANTFAMDYVGGLRALGNYGNLSTDITDIWAIVCGELPAMDGDIVNYLSMDKALLEKAKFNFADHGTVTIPLDTQSSGSNTEFTVWQQKDSSGFEVEGVTGNTFAIPYTQAGKEVKGRFITVKATDTISDLYDLGYFADKIAPLTGTDETFAHLVTTGVKLGADLSIDETSGYSAFAMPAPFDGQGHKLTLKNVSLFTTAKTVSNLVVESNKASSAIASGAVEGLSNIVAIIDNDAAASDVTLFAASSGNNAGLTTISYVKTYDNSVAASDHRVVGARGNMIITYANGAFLVEADTASQGEVEFVSKDDSSSAQGLYSYYFVKTTIDSETDLKAIAELNAANQSTENKNFTLNADIVLTAPISGLKGSFNGTGHSVTFAVDGAYAQAFTSFEGSIQNMVISGLNAAAEKKTTLENVLIITDKLDGGAATIGNNVWLFVDTLPEKPVASLNYLTGANASNTEYSAVYGNGAAAFTFTAKGTEAQGMIFGGFDKSGTVTKTFTTSALDANSRVERRSINSVLKTLEDWNKMVQAANAGVYTSADNFELGADIAVKDAFFANSFDMNLNGKGFKLNVEGRASKLANVNGKWSNVVFVGNYTGTIIEIALENSVDNWAVNNAVNLRGINRVTGTDVLFRYQAEGDLLTVYVENNANLVKTTANNSPYTAEYAAFTAKKATRTVNNRIDFSLLSGNRITNSAEFSLYAKGNGNLSPEAIIELGADITTDIASIVNKVHFKGNGHTIAVADGSTMTFANEGFVDTLVIRGSTVTFTSNGSSYGSTVVTTALADPASARTQNVLIIDKESATVVNEKLSVEGDASSVTAETQTVTLENASGANVTANFNGTAFELSAGINAQKTSMFLGYKKADGSYADVSKFVFGDAEVTKLVFANPTVSTVDEYNALIGALNETVSVVGNRQNYIVNITAGFEGGLTELKANAEIIGNFNKIGHTGTGNLFASAFVGRAENLMVESASSVVIDSGNKSVFDNVWLLRNGVPSSALHPQLGVLSMNGKGNDVTLSVSEKNGAFAVDVSFTDGNGNKNMAQWSDGSSEYIAATSYVLPRTASKLSVNFVTVTKIKLGFDDLEIKALDKEYDGTNGIDYELSFKNSASYPNIVLTGKNLKLKTTKTAAGTGYNVEIDNKGEVYFGSIENSAISDKTYYINVDEFAGKLNTVNIEKRKITLQFAPQTESYTDATAKDANNIVKSRVLGINDPALKALISSDLGSGKNWYDAVSGTIKLKGADGTIYDATSKLVNQDYFLDTDSVTLSSILRSNYEFDKSTLIAMAGDFALRYNISGTVKIVQSAPDSVSMLNGISDLKNNFFRLDGVGELYGNTAALGEILKKIVYDGSDFLVLRDDGKLWVDTSKLGSLLKVKGSVASDPNYNVTVQDCEVTLKTESYKVTRVGNNSNVYLADVKSPTIESADSQIFSDGVLKERFRVSIARVSGDTLLDVGQYLLKVSIYDNWYTRDVTDFVDITFAKDDLQYYTVTPCPIVVTLNNIDTVYALTIADWKYDVAVLPDGVDIGLQNAIGITVVGNPEIKDYDILGRVDVGSYFLTAGTVRLGESDKINNYKLEIKTNNAKLNVEKAKLTIEGVGKTVVYGYSSLPENEVVFKDSLGNSVNADDLGFADGFIKFAVKMPSGSAVSDDKLVKLDAANYSIGIELDSADKMYKNYSFTLTPAVLEVTQRPVTVGFAAGKGVYTKEYNQDFEIGDSDLVYGPVAGNPDSGFLEGEENYCFYDFYDSFDPKFHVWYPNLWYDETIGTTGLYAIEFDDGNYMPDYLTSQVGEITVTKAKITIVVSGGSSKEQGSNDPKFRYSFEGGKSVKEEHISGVLSREGGEKTGKYKITKGSLTIDPLYYDIVEWKISDDAILVINRAANENAMFMILAAVLGVILGVSMVVAGTIIYVKKKKNGGKLPPKKKKVKKSKKGKNEKREDSETLDSESAEITRISEAPVEETEEASATDESSAGEKPEKEKAKKSKEKRRKKDIAAAPVDCAPSHDKKDEWAELTEEPTEEPTDETETTSVSEADAETAENAPESEIAAEEPENDVQAAIEVQEAEPTAQKKRGRKKVDE